MLLPHLKYDLGDLVGKGLYKGVSRLQKPDKFFLENTNLSHAINPIPDKGNLRETFLLGQLINAGFDVFEPHSGDFLVDGTTIEVGGKNKSAKQVKGEALYLVVADDIESGFGKKFLYGCSGLCIEVSPMTFKRGDHFRQNGMT